MSFWCLALLQALGQQQKCGRQPWRQAWDGGKGGLEGWGLGLIGAGKMQWKGKEGDQGLGLGLFLGFFRVLLFSRVFCNNIHK